MFFFFDSSKTLSFCVARRVQSALAVADIFSSIGQLHGVLDYHLERHNVLASNLAHVDTPNYKPHDLARVNAADFTAVLNVAMEKTNAAHMSGPDASAPSVGQVFEDLSAGAGADGNYVSLDREASKVAANHLRYDVVSAIASAELRQLTYAANDGKG